MHITRNTHNLPKSIIRSRLALLGVEEVQIINVVNDDEQNITLIETQSAIDALSIDAALLTPPTAEEITAKQDRQTTLDELKAQYQTAMDRLTEIINTPNPTQVNLATLTAMANAIRDIAIIERRHLKVSVGR